MKLYWDICGNTGVGDGRGVQDCLVIRRRVGEGGSSRCGSSREMKVSTAINHLVFWLVDGDLCCSEGSTEKRKGKGGERTHGEGGWAQGSEGGR